MRIVALLLCLCVALPLWAFGSEDEEVAARKVYDQWLTAKNPVERIRLAQAAATAAIEANDPDKVRDIARGGPNREHLISTELVRPRTVNLAETFSVKYSDFQVAPSPNGAIFRRINQNRIEMWTVGDGWLFDGKGRLLFHVKVPRRDGRGREWLGAFQPDGRWITTDLWEEDKQINCFSPTGKWLWELDGLDVLQKEARGNDEDVKPLWGWARSDRQGRGWVASLGSDFCYQTVSISPSGKAKLEARGNPWRKTYPRAMGARDRRILSDDGTLSLSVDAPMHGPFACTPLYSLGYRWLVRVPGGDWGNLGFWPKSHRCYIGAVERTWFFTASGSYQGEVQGSVFGDAANGIDLLLKDDKDRVIEISPQLAVQGIRSFQTVSGDFAKPLTLYDGLKLGFFSIGGDANRRMVLGRW